MKKADALAKRPEDSAILPAKAVFGAFGVKTDKIRGVLCTVGRANIYNGVDGVSISGAGLGAPHMKGLSISGIMSDLGAVDGIALSGLITVSESVDGASVSLWMNEVGQDARGVLVGLVNNCHNSMTGLAIGARNGAPSMNGLAIGIINGLETDRSDSNTGRTAATVNGASIGAVNLAGTANGVQIGLVNYVALDSSVVQIGLLNIRRDAPWYSRVVPGIAVRLGSIRRRRKVNRLFKEIQDGDSAEELRDANRSGLRTLKKNETGVGGPFRNTGWNVEDYRAVASEFGIAGRKKLKELKAAVDGLEDAGCRGAIVHLSMIASDPEVYGHKCSLDAFRILMNCKYAREQAEKLGVTMERWHDVNPKHERKPIDLGHAPPGDNENCHWTSYP